ncbi:MAG: DUF3822 domain-containing protein [Bacteroidetes bacterium]|nr:MAG: DUF3822 domain-containing protein [Bacteroidota bacterium]
METGQKTIQANNNINKNSDNILSIQVSLSGLSFCILNTNSNTIPYYKHVKFSKKGTPPDALDKLIHCFNTEEALQQEFNSVIIVHENELSSLVPKPLFNKDCLADYLKFNSKILRTDYITYDAVLANDSINVYVPYVNINNFIYDRFGSFEFKHYSTLLIETILALEKHSSSAKMYVNVCESHFEIIIAKKNKLKLYNSFEYISKEDFIYYILFTAEQLQLNPEKFQLLLIGYINKDDDLYKIAYNYVRNVEILRPKHKYNSSADCKTQLLNEFILLNSF